jgi:hypothetical protein
MRVAETPPIRFCRFAPQTSFMEIFSTTAREPAMALRYCLRWYEAHRVKSKGPGICGEIGAAGRKHYRKRAAVSPASRTWQLVND